MCQYLHYITTRGIIYTYQLTHNFMVYRIAGGIFIALLGLQLCGLMILPDLALGVIGVIAGTALLSGF